MTSSGRQHSVRGLHESLFALNVGLSVAIVLRAFVARFAPGQNGIADCSLGEIEWINRLLHLYPPEYNHIGAELSFLSWILGSGIAAFLLIQFLRYAGLKRAALHGALLTALGAVPVSILCASLAEYAGVAAQPTFFVVAEGKWLIAEITIAVACAVVYLGRKWPLQPSATTILLVLHYSLWSWVLLHLFSPTVWAASLSLIPPCAGIAWVLYEKQEFCFAHGAEHRLSES